MKPLRLRTSLTLAYVAILSLVSTGLGIAFHRTFARQLDADTTEALNEKAQALHGFLRFENGTVSLVYDTNDPEESRFIDDATDYYQVYDAANGRLLAQSPGLEAFGLRYTPAQVAEHRLGAHVHDVETYAGRLRLTSSLITPRPGEAYLVEVGELLAATDRTLARLDRILLLGIAASIAVAGLLGPWFARRALAPMKALAMAAHGVTIGDLHSRVDLRGSGDELDQVADSFNNALARLEESVDDMRVFSAALAHELRTPIAILRGEAELELAHPLAVAERQSRLLSQIEECDRLTRLIDQVLTLARAEAGEIKLATEPVALGRLASAVAEQMEPVAAARDIVLTADAADDGLIDGDPNWLRRLILILLDNAIKFTPELGQVAIRVSRTGEAVCLAVTDTGIGIEPDQIPGLFRRFHRGGTLASRRIPGFGLGLALAKWIADRHGATVQVTSRPGVETTFRFLFPGAAAR